MRVYLGIAHHSSSYRFEINLYENNFTKHIVHRPTHRKGKNFWIETEFVS